MRETGIGRDLAAGVSHVAVPEHCGRLHFYNLLK